MIKSVSAVLVLAVVLIGSFGCNSAKSGSNADGPMKITPETVHGAWEGGADGDIASREAFFAEDGTGQLRVVIKSDTFDGSIRYDFTYEVDAASGSLRLINALDDSGESKPGKAELNSDGTMHFVLEGQDCVLTRSAVNM